MTKTDKMATAKTGVRNSSFEILRIIAILCIVASFSHSPWLIPFSFGVVFAVFAVGVALTGLYRYSVGFLIAKGLNWAEKKVLYRIDNALSYQETDAPENDYENNRENRVTSEKEN